MPQPFTLCLLQPPTQQAASLGLKTGLTSLIFKCILVEGPAAGCQGSRQGRGFDNQDNMVLGLLAISTRNLREPPTMAKLIPAALYWLKISVSLGLFWVLFQLTQTSKREGNLCYFLINRILCLVEPTAPPNPPHQQVPRVFLTSSNSSAIRAASLFHFPFAFISKAQQPRGL